jgi:hypothetical protein
MTDMIAAREVAALRQELDNERSTREGLEAELSRVKAERDELLEAAKAAIPAAEYPRDPTIGNWAWQIRNLGDDRRACYRLLSEARRAPAAPKETR